MEKTFKDLVIKNPELPIKFFVREECTDDEYQYKERKMSEVRIANVTFYNGKYIVEDAFGDQLYADLFFEFGTVEELYAHIDRVVAEATFEKAICVILD